MSYKTILVHVDESTHAPARIAVAANLALAQDAHLIGAAFTGVSRFIEQALATKADSPAISPYLDTLRSRARKVLDLFDEQVRGLGVQSFERRMVDDESIGGITLQARYCDLAVVGQTDPREPGTSFDTEFPEHVALGSGSPVLIVPYAPFFDRVGARVVVAWNGSREARRAVQDALPLLQQAKHVEVVVFNAAERSDLLGGQPGIDISHFLYRHGVNFSVRNENVEHREIGKALLSIAEQSPADLLVMGCYGHSRFREMLLGGVTRDILASMTLPVFMSH